MMGESRQRTFTSRAIARLKAQVSDDNGPAIALARDDSPVVRAFADLLLVSYVVDVGEAYQLVQYRHLAGEGIDESSLHSSGLDNLAQLVTARATRVQPYGDIFAVVMGGDFEASLMLVDTLWAEQFRQFVRGDYAVAVPARDILAFCDASSTAGLDELHRLIQRVFPKAGGQALSDRLYVRRQRAWDVVSVN